MGDRCIRPTQEELENFGTPDFTIYNAGQFPCNRYTHYMTSSTSIDLNLARREMVILGTQYAGEMKKGLFGVMHYLMPKRQILSLHSGCNMGKDGDVAVFFGLSGNVGSTILMRNPPTHKYDFSLLFNPHFFFSLLNFGLLDFGFHFRYWKDDIINRS